MSDLTETARVTGVTRGGSWVARLAFFLCRRRWGRVVRSLRIYALHTPLLMGYGHMERAQEKATQVPSSLKSLGSIRIAMRLGCPF